MALPHRLTQNLEFQSQALLLRAQRQQVLASNIANVDTPGYVARDLDFSAALRQATEHLPSAARVGASGSVPSGLAMRPLATQAGHIGLPVIAGSGGSTLAYAAASQNSVDRNTVDMDRERATFADNSVRYEAALRFINGGVRTMLDAMKSHNQ